MTTPLPPPPVPTAPPTETVVVTIPPEVLDRLTPHEGWFTQPVATVCAAAIALAAAAFAWNGVRRQIRGTALQAKRERQLDALTDAAKSSLGLLEAAGSANFIGGPSAEVSVEITSTYASALAEARLGHDKLVLGHLSKSAEAMDSFITFATEVANARAPVANLGSIRRRLLETFAEDSQGIIQGAI